RDLQRDVQFEPADFPYERRGGKFWCRLLRYVRKSNGNKWEHLRRSSVLQCHWRRLPPAARITGNRCRNQRKYPAPPRFDGVTRPLDGNGDGMAIIDMGIYEAPILDFTPPVTTASATPTTGPAGWNTTSVSVTLTATDNEGGSGVQSIRYSES